MSLMTIWLIIFVACVAIEIATMGLTTIWFAGGSLIAAIAALAGAPLWLQLILFIGVSLVLLYFTRPIAVKYFNKDRIKTNAESLIGKQAIVISEINNLQGIGQVTIGGQEWTARTIQEKLVVSVGSIVVVRAINGVKLMIEEVPANKTAVSPNKEENEV